MTELLDLREGVGELSRLTRRETEVLAAMAAGRTNAAIAADLVLSRRAVEKHINAIFSKLGLSGDGEHHARVQAVLLYLGHRSDPGGAGTAGPLAAAGAVRRPAADRPVTWRLPRSDGHQRAGSCARLARSGFRPSAAAR